MLDDLQGVVAQHVSPCLASLCQTGCIAPCRGKLLNVREASATQITGNAEIQNIKQIMGLQHGKVRQHDRDIIIYDFEQTM